MADRLFRLEKTDEQKRAIYVEYHREAQNTLVRLWCVYDSNGRIVPKNEREHFQTTADADTYLANMKAAYIKQGYKVTFDSSPVKTTGKKKAVEAEDAKEPATLGADELS